MKYGVYLFLHFLLGFVCVVAGVNLIGLIIIFLLVKGIEILAITGFDRDN